MQSPRLSLKITDFSSRIRNPGSQVVYSCSNFHAIFCIELEIKSAGESTERFEGRGVTDDRGDLPPLGKERTGDSRHPAAGARARPDGSKKSAQGQAGVASQHRQ